MSQANNPTLGKWNLVKNGATLITFQSFLESDSQAEARVSQQPLENGSYTSYNKVISPMQRNLQLGLMATELEIITALQILNTEIENASLVQVITPLGATPEMTITKLDYSQNITNAYGRLDVNLSLQQIKQVEAQYSNTAISQGVTPISANQASNPQDVSNTDSGIQQAQEPQESLLFKLL